MVSFFLKAKNFSLKYIYWVQKHSVNHSNTYFLNNHLITYTYEQLGIDTFCALCLYCFYVTQIAIIAQNYTSAHLATR